MHTRSASSGPYGFGKPGSYIDTDGVVHALGQPDRLVLREFTNDKRRYKVPTQHLGKVLASIDVREVGQLSFAWHDAVVTECEKMMSGGEPPWMTHERRLRDAWEAAGIKRVLGRGP